ncbi:hypothetical protein BK816_03690 [Boudabousia tangfeifanii]|uniref:ATP synthase F1 complex delta/epsilon subunit N-terminal domain-containing protein n=1 Tax=Boudabousia tangfeifanii TaxID=1912795 RepID=A0A1D9MJZ6_9ACTO|nr:hypothetical protein [Boudabousia tangfeifanii]AOZ72509.1 hypothetical protein BK816_03690 [Boudabousia tangfeifanii]
MSMHASVVSRTETLFDGECSAVVVPASSGQLGILPGHEPLIGVLGKGTLKITTGTDELMFEIGDGIFSVDDDLVTIACQSGKAA